MGRTHERGIESSAAIGGHPIHPLLVVFPVASLIGVLGTDLAFRATGNAFWAEASWWLLMVGLVMGIVAGIAGAIDFFSNQDIRSLVAAKVHAGGNVLALVLAAVNIGVRAGDVTQIAGLGLILSAVTVAILGVTGWLGGELSFRYGVGMMAREGANVR